MIAMTSLVGFALVFLVLTMALSLVAGAVARFAAARLSGRAALERRAAGAALVLPPVLALAVTAALLGHSALGPALGLPDHCSRHEHHLHLCLFHGAGWGHRLWAVATVGVALLVSVVRVVVRVARWLSARRLLRTLHDVSRTVTVEGVCLVPTRQHFCFSAGIVAPRIFFSSASWERLAPAERRAVLAHERAHIAHGDVWRRAGLGLLGLFGAPGVTPALLRWWEGASERLCDREAAVCVGDPTIVASALLALAGAGRTIAAPGSAFVSDADVVGRVEALIAGHPSGDEAARRLGRAATGFAAASTLLAAVASDPLHHLFETLLGGI